MSESDQKAAGKTGERTVGITYGPSVIGTVGFIHACPSVPYNFFRCLVDMQSYNSQYLCNPGEVIEYVDQQGGFHDESRNTLVRRFLGDWLLQLDTDIEFEPDLLARMMLVAKRYKAEVVTCPYRRKEPPHNTVIANYDQDLDEFIALSDAPAEVAEVGACGAGCLLVFRNLFARIWNELGEMPFDLTYRGSRGGRWSEDYSFCRRLHKLNPPVKIYCCGHIRLKHAGIV